MVHIIVQMIENKGKISSSKIESIKASNRYETMESENNDN